MYINVNVRADIIKRVITILDDAISMDDYASSEDEVEALNDVIKAMHDGIANAAKPKILDFSLTFTKEV